MARATPVCARATRRIGMRIYGRPRRRTYLLKYRAKKNRHTDGGKNPTPAIIGVILGGREVRTPHFLEWKDGPPIYKYTKSNILLGPPPFSDQYYATASDCRLTVCVGKLHAVSADLYEPRRHGLFYGPMAFCSRLQQQRTEAVGRDTNVDAERPT